MSYSQIWNVLRGFNILVLVDILAVAWLIYRLLLLAKGTRAWQIIGGLVVFVLAVWISDKLQLISLHWLLKQAFPLGPVALVILFLPELRHALEEFGQLRFWSTSFGLVKSEEMTRMVDEVVTAVSTMSVKRIGALIVFERTSGLEDIIANGTIINGEATSGLLGTIFYKGSPLHDGAVVIRNDKVIAAGCTLPLTDSPKVDAAVHTRHKAALGMSEASDAVVVTVSEETGTVSIATDGKLIRGLRDDVLRKRLIELLQIDESDGSRTTIGNVASRVGDAIKTARTVRRGFGQ